MPVDFTLQAKLLLAPITSHLVVKVAADRPVQLLDIHGANTVPETLVLGPKPLDRGLVLVGVAGVKRLPHPGKNVIVKPELAQ